MPEPEQANPEPLPAELEFHVIHNRLVLQETEPFVDGLRRWQIQGREEYSPGSGTDREMRELAALILRTIPELEEKQENC